MRGEEKEYAYAAAKRYSEQIFAAYKIFSRFMEQVCLLIRLNI
jgi:hypothetical protein